MKKVFVVSKTHLDIGFTDFAENIKKKYINEFIPSAIALADKVNKNDEKNFIWTTGSWILREALKYSDESNKEKLTKAIKDGNIVPHGLPFTTHTELLDVDTLEYGLSIVDELDNLRGKKTISAKMTDVPGHTKGLVTLLHKKGIKLLHIGVNGASAIPEVPECFLWRNGESEVVVIYSAAYGGAYKSDFVDEVLYFDHTVDNRGAPSPQRVLEHLDDIRKEFPGYKVVAGTMDDYAEAIWKVRYKLPVIENEIGDTWIHGSTTDPYKAGALRTLISLKEKWLVNGSLVKNTDEYYRICEGILCLAEHTCGLDSKMYLADYENYLKKDFIKARKRDKVILKHPLREYPLNFNVIKKRKSGEYSEGSYSTMEKSWAEQRKYILDALNALTDVHRKEAETELGKLRPIQKEKAPETELKTDILNVFGWQFKINSFGGIGYLAFNEENIIRENDEPVIEYRSYSKENYDYWHENYSRDLKGTAEWVYGDFGRPLLKYAEGKYKKGSFYYKKENAFISQNENEAKLFVDLNCEKSLCEDLGAPREIQIIYTLTKENIKIDVSWFNKDANRLTEAIYFKLYPLENEISLEKLGASVDPYKVVSKGSRNLHAVRNTVLKNVENTINITNLTTPLISIGKGKILEFDNEFENLQDGISYVLYNNVWGTNFPLWYEENAHFEFLIGVESNDLP